MLFAIPLIFRDTMQYFRKIIFEFDYELKS